MNILRTVVTAVVLRTLGAVLSHAAVATAMAILWVNPMAFGPEAADDVELLLVLEFLVLHSTAFLVGFRFIKGFPRWIFILVYAPFAFILGASSSSYLVTVLFLWHLASGVWGDFDLAERHIGGFLVRYLPTFLWFAVLPFAVVLLGLPALGWEAYPGLAFRADNGFRSAALIPAWATLYFVGRALWEIAIRRWERTGKLQRFITAMQNS